MIACSATSVAILKEKSVKKWINEQLLSVFGVVGASIDVDVLHCSSEDYSFLIRVPFNNVTVVRSALTLAEQFEGEPCVVQFEKASTQLIAMANNSRRFDLDAFSTI